MFTSAGLPLGASQQARFQRMRRTAEMLSQCIEAVLRANSDQELLDRVLKTLVRGGIHSQAWFGIPTGRGQEVTILARALSDGTEGAAPVDERQRSVAALALRDGRPQVKRRSIPDGPMSPHALVAIPVHQKEDNVAVLVLTTAEAEAFDDEELDLLERVSANMAHGIQTLRRRSELDRLVTELARSEESFRKLFQVSPVALSLVREGMIVQANQACASLFGQDRPALDLPLPLSEVLAPEVHNDIFDTAARRMRGEQVPTAYRTRGRRPDGSLFHLQVGATVVDLPEGRSTLVFLTDVTEQVNAQEATRLYEEKLRALAAEVAQVEERERRHLADLLHDGVIQNLTAVKNRLSMLRRQAASETVVDETVGELLELLTSTIADTRSLTTQISPPVLYHLGLEAALEWLGEWLEERFGLHLTIDSETDEPTLPEEIRALLFRSVRELLINVGKHAGTDRATVRLSYVADEVRVRVEDEGCGFAPGALTLAGSSGFGLFSIKERMEYWGGRLEIDSAPGQGTRTTIVLPLASPAPDA